MKARWLVMKKQYWDSRAERERLSLTLAALILTPLLVFFLLWQPAHNAVEKLRPGVATLRLQAAKVQAQASVVEQLRHHPEPAVFDAAALQSAIEASAQHHQLRESITTLDVSPPNAVRITLASISFEQWLRWLRALQQEQHIRADSVGIVALPQAGMVKISATLSNGGRQ